MFDLKFQTFAIGILCVLIINFARNQKLPIFSTRIFYIFLMLTTLNLIADISAVYTLYHMETVPAWANRLAHQFFIGSLDAILYTLYIYIGILADDQRRFFAVEGIIKSLPFYISILFVIFAPVTFTIEENGRHSGGLMVSTIYFSIIFYDICIFIQLHKIKPGYFALVREYAKHHKLNAKTYIEILLHKKKYLMMYDLKTSFGELSEQKSNAITYGIGIQTIFGLLQFLYPTKLVSSIGLTFMVLLIYLSFENPREYADAECKCLNRRAFHLMVSELLERKKQFYLVDIVLEEMNYLQTVMGYEEARNVFTYLGQQIKGVYKERFYHSRNNVFSVFIMNNKDLNCILEKLETMSVEYQYGNETTIVLKFKVNVIEVPKYAASVDELYDMVDYMRNMKPNKLDRILYADPSILKKKNYQTAVEALVENAIKKNGLEVYYQPIYHTGSKTFQTAEALVRLKDKETLGYISPDVFIPIAEDKGLIIELGNIVFTKVCEFASEQRLWEKGIKYLEVNLSGIQSVHESLVDKLAEIMQQYSIKPTFINLEITETVAVSGGDMLMKNMERLRSLGCHFSMDDFGTGYSNLSQIARVKFEMIKLDKSLIWPCFAENGEGPMVILDTCIQMISKLGGEIVAEGVETKEQADELIHKGVHYLQGFYYSKPVCEEDYLEFIENANERETRVPSYQYI